jgi:hypothetical protein
MNQRSIDMRHGIALAVCLTLLGCSDYEQEQLKAAGDNIQKAAQHVGNASSSAADRARASTAGGLRSTAGAIEPDSQDEDSDAE